MAALTQNLGLIGTATQAVGTILAGRQAAAAGEYNAKVLNQRAMSERASASRSVAEVHREKQLLQSRARAVAAASGGGPVPELIADIEKEGQYRALTALYEGDTRAQGLQAQGQMARYEGRRAASQSRWSALGTILDAGPSLMEKYADRLPDWMTT